MQVLIIGYGMIGRVKARVWKSLGLDVLVYDTSSDAVVRARNDGYAIYIPHTSLHDEYLVDISTPAGHHCQALEWAIANGAARPRAVLIEKPLASTEAEMHAFRALDDGTSSKHLTHNIFINESYVSSSALAVLKNSIEEVGEIIESLEVELSKNRLADNSQGRFFDRYLNAIGHEVPHMLAVLQMFGFDFEQVLRSKSATLYIDENCAHNEAFLLDTRYKGANIKLISYLGNYRISSKNLVKNEGLTRRISIATNKGVYNLCLDPAPGLPRYTSCLNVINDGASIESTIIPDDHLRAHLSNFLRGQRKINSSFYDFRNGLQVSEALIQARRSCKLEKIGFFS